MAARKDWQFLQKGANHVLPTFKGGIFPHLCMGEHDLNSRIMKAVSKETPAVVFRNNTGMAWQGDVQKLRDGSVLIKNPRPIHAGLIKGASDMIGFTSITVTAEMVGQRVALFTALEAKTGKLKATPEQLQFVKVVQESGGIAAIVRTESEALNAILSRIKALNSQINMTL